MTDHTDDQALTDAQELINILQERQGESAREWEGKIAVLHLQYRKQLRAQQKEIEELNAKLAKTEGSNEEHPSDG